MASENKQGKDEKSFSASSSSSSSVNEAHVPGSLILSCGVMGSGKTFYLLQKLREYATVCGNTGSKQIRVLYVRSAKDCRWASTDKDVQSKQWETVQVVKLPIAAAAADTGSTPSYALATQLTHNGLFFPDVARNTWAVAVVNRLDELDVWSGMGGIDRILVDEGHFYPDLGTTVSRWIQQGKRVVVSMLESDYMQKPFSGFVELVTQCEKLVRHETKCVLCGKRRAIWNRLLKPASTTSADSIIVGGSDLYQSRCRHCFAL